MKKENARKTLVISVLLIIMSLLIIGMGIGILKGEVRHCQYPQVMVVTDISNGQMTFRDHEGNKWIVNDDPEDMDIYDFVAVLMDNNGTLSIYDDFVVQWQYSGFVYRFPSYPHPDNLVWPDFGFDKNK